MKNRLQKAIENRRNKLIDKLIAFSVYKKEDKHLFELSLSELEDEYRKFKSICHPHFDLGALRWNGNITKNK
ncbi:Fur-regulated basic protein FbpA [Bacillus sp. BRMEA1]|nr:Fur-regulated basic protein FbpA [Neobacillus endophyticus]